MPKQYDKYFDREPQDKADKRIKRTIMKWWFKRRSKADRERWGNDSRTYSVEFVRNNNVLLTIKVSRAEYDDAFYPGYNSGWTREQVKCWLYENGFDCVRIPYNWSWSRRSWDLKIEAFNDRDYDDYILRLENIARHEAKQKGKTSGKKGRAA